MILSDYKINMFLKRLNDRYHMMGPDGPMRNKADGCMALARYLRKLLVI